MGAGNEGRPDAAPSANGGFIAVFAGTAEGRLLCERLSAAGRVVHAFAATPYGGELLEGLPGVSVEAARLDADAMTRRLSGAQLAVDATHPYAAAASANVREACRAAGVRLVRLVRPSTFDAGSSDADGVVTVPDAAAAAAFLGESEGAVLLTTGSKDLAAYAAIPGLARRCWPRMLPDAANVTRALDLGFPESQLICLQGPFSRELNVALLRHADARWLVTKDTGRVGGFEEKLAAAQEAGAGVVLIARPTAREEGRTLEEVEALLGL